MRSFQDRIVGLERISSDELDDHPGNWRDHTDEQVSALLGVLGEVGIADALLAYRSERNGGRMTVIDGHLRKGAVPQIWPVLVLDVNDAEADYILTTHDPLAAMAQTDAASLSALLDSITSEQPAVQQMLAQLAKDAGVFVPELFPNQAFTEFTGIDVDKENERLLGRFTGNSRAQVGVVCPSCGEEFFINREDMASAIH